MSAFLSTTKDGYTVHVLSERYVIVWRQKFTTAQAAFDFLEDNYPGVAVNVEILARGE